MKTNEAPTKIYLQVCGDCPQTDCDNCKFEDFEDNITWCKDKIFKKDIEYTRTDAFIEKACGWLRENKNKYVYNWGRQGGYIPTCSNLLIKDFKKYMKGE